MLVMRSKPTVGAPLAPLRLEIRRGVSTAPASRGEVLIADTDDEDGHRMVGQIRRALTRYLAAAPEPPGDDVVDTVVLCTSEVVTNALTHTASRVVMLTASVLEHGRAVRVAVADQDRTGRVRRSRATEDDEGGRGLGLLSRCAKWGCRRDAKGKEVWFVVPRRQRMSGWSHS